MLMTIIKHHAWIFILGQKCGGIPAHTHKRNKIGCMDSVDWMDWTGLDWTRLDWNGMARCNFVINFCGRDQTLTRVGATSAVWCVCV